MGGFFSFILGIILFAYLLKLLLIYVLPWFIRRRLEKMQGDCNRTNENRKEGEIRVEKTTPNKEYSNKSDIGEYIDFEEVK